MKTIYFAGGCFWGTQKYFDQFDGVVRTEVGYANGPEEAPSYEDVCASSGHAETVLVEFEGIYYSDPDMLETIRKAYDEEETLIGAPLAVEVKPLANFFTAEEYHQKYLDKNPAGYCHIPAEFFTLADK